MMLKKKWHIILPIIVAVCSMLDLTSTLIALNLPDGVFEEGNPVMRYLFDHFGYVGASAIKILLTVFQCLLTWDIIKKGDKIMSFILSAATLTAFSILGLWWAFCWFFYFSYVQM
jgi:hypothetical protein